MRHVSLSKRWPNYRGILNTEDIFITEANFIKRYPYWIGFLNRQVSLLQGCPY